MEIHGSEPINRIFGGILIVLKVAIVCDYFQGQLRSSP